MSAAPATAFGPGTHWKVSLRRIVPCQMKRSCADHREGGKRTGRRTDKCEEGQVVGQGDPRPKQPEGGGRGNARPGPKPQCRYHRGQGNGDEEPPRRPNGSVVVTEDTVKLFGRERERQGRSG